MFDMLKGLFDRVGLKTNVRKKVGMVCHSCQAVGVRSDEAYTRRMTGAVRSYKERQREGFIYHECREELMRGALAAHCQTHHGVAKGVPGQGVEG